jgi:hypothetical protein
MKKDPKRMVKVNIKFPKPGKKKKGVKATSLLQKKKDNSNSLYWKKKAMAKWGEVVHHLYRVCAVDNGHCKGRLEAHHLLSRSRVLTRNDPDNAIVLCSYHHKFSTKLSPHGAPIQFTQFLQKNYPHMIDYVNQHKNDMGAHDYKRDYEELCGGTLE